MPPTVSTLVVPIWRTLEQPDGVLASAGAAMTSDPAAAATTAAVPAMVRLKIDMRRSFPGSVGQHRDNHSSTHDGQVSIRPPFPPGAGNRVGIIEPRRREDEMIRGEETVRDIGVPGCKDATEIGRGGFGVVYRARQPAISRTVAVKVLAADGLDVDARHRFEGEVRAMGRLGGHPHIVTVHQAGFTAGGNPYILMAYEDGGSLADRGPAGSWPEAVAGGITIAGALESAHRAGLLHRDVTPRNILVSRYGEPKLADL